MVLKKGFHLSALVFFALIAFGGQGVFASDVGTHIEQSRNVAAPARADAPIGFQLLCLTKPSACNGGGASQITLSIDAMRVMHGVNLGVNVSLIWKPERLDTWTLDLMARYGDCEDFALIKRALLIDAGFPPSALRIATARTASGEGHAVLIVRTDRGDYVLDNRRSSIVLRQASGLTFIAMSGADPHEWERLS